MLWQACRRLILGLGVPGYGVPLYDDPNRRFAKLAMVCAVPVPVRGGCDDEVRWS